MAAALATVRAGTDGEVVTTRARTSDGEVTREGEGRADSLGLVARDAYLIPSDWTRL